MTQSAIFEQHTLDIEQKQPWERQPGESPKWHMRFRRYLALGSKRNVNAVYEAEQQERATKSRGKAGETWYNAARKYQWQARADAWDEHVDGQQAAAMRQVAASMPFVSRPFRLVQLNILATALSRKSEEGMAIDDFLACCKVMQSLMHDIAEEVTAWGVTVDHTADSAALLELTQKNLRVKDLEAERELDQEIEIDRLIMQHKEMQERIKRSRHVQKELEQGKQ